MTIATVEDALRALTPGCCTREAAAESGCALCVPRYAAIDWLREKHDELLSDAIVSAGAHNAAERECDRYRTELREIQRIAEPGHAWPYERVTRCLETPVPTAHRPCESRDYQREQGSCSPVPAAGGDTAGVLRDETELHRLREIERLAREYVDTPYCDFGGDCFSTNGCASCNAVRKLRAALEAK